MELDMNIYIHLQMILIEMIDCLDISQVLHVFIDVFFNSYH